MHITTHPEGEYHTITTATGHELAVSYEAKHRGRVMVDGADLPLTPAQLAALAANYETLQALAGLAPAQQADG